MPGHRGSWDCEAVAIYSYSYSYIYIYLYIYIFFMAGTEAGCLFVAGLAQRMREINLKTIGQRGSSWLSNRPPDNAGNIIRTGINIYNAPSHPSTACLRRIQ